MSIVHNVTDRRYGWIGPWEDANLSGRPFNPLENIDWRLGWQNAQDDRRLEDDHDQ